MAKRIPSDSRKALACLKWLHGVFSRSNNDKKIHTDENRTNGEVKTQDLCFYCSGSHLTKPSEYQNEFRNEKGNFRATFPSISVVCMWLVDLFLCCALRQ